MTKMEYAQKVAELINGEVHEVKKNNGVVYTGVTIHTEGGVAPIMYIDEFFEREADVEEAAEGFKKVFDKVDDFKINTDALYSFENAKSSLFVKLINKKNADEDIVYKSAEEYGYNDLILVPVVQVDVPGGKAFTKISKEILENWGVTADEVINAGIENIDCIVEPLVKRLSKITGLPEEFFGENPFMIVSTGDGLYGAVAIIKAEEELKNVFPNGYIVIPSSIHEMLVMSCDAIEEDKINDLVGDINEHALSPEERLSNNVYKFVERRTK